MTVITAIIVLLVVLFWIWLMLDVIVQTTSAPQPYQYRNLLRLSFLSRFKWCQPTAKAAIKRRRAWNETQQDGWRELLHLYGVFEKLQREEKSLAEHVASLEDRRECLDDLASLLKWIQTHQELSKPGYFDTGDLPYSSSDIVMLENFKELVKEQDGRVRAWREPRRPYVEQITFENLGGAVELTRNGKDEATAFALMLPAGAYRVTVQKDGQEALSEESGGEDCYDFVKAGIGAIRNGQVIIEDLQNGQRERVPFW